MPRPQLSHLSHSKLVGKLLARATAATERAPVPTSAGTSAHRNSPQQNSVLASSSHPIIIPLAWNHLPTAAATVELLSFPAPFFSPGIQLRYSPEPNKERASNLPLATDKLPAHPPTCPILTQTFGPAPATTNVPVDTNVIAPTRDLHQARRQLQIPTLNTLPDCDQPSPHSPSATSQLPGWIQTWRTLGACPPS
jgi:hypothetical protein